MLPIIPIWTKLLIYSFFTIMPSLISEHPIYLSSTEIAYNKTSKSLEISVKIFADDLEPVLSKLYKQRIELGTDREHPNTKEYLFEYLKDNFIIYTDGKMQSFKYIGHESGDKTDMFAMYIYLEAENVEPFLMLKVNNSILIDNLSNQLNFISCHTNSGLKKLISRKGDLVQEIKW